jgi:hypothetical protein
MMLTDIPVDRVRMGSSWRAMAFGSDNAEQDPDLFRGPKNNIKRDITKEFFGPESIRPLLASDKSLKTDEFSSTRRMEVLF